MQTFLVNSPMEKNIRFSLVYRFEIPVQFSCTRNIDSSYLHRMVTVGLPSHTTGSQGTRYQT